MKFNFYENRKRFTALVLAGTLIATPTVATGCGSKNNKSTDEVEKTQNLPVEENLQDDSVVDENSKVQSLVENLTKKVSLVMPDSKNEELNKNVAIMLLLDLIAAKDENGKINVEEISNLKSRLDVTNIMSDYNNFLDKLLKEIIDGNDLPRISGILPVELNNDKEILNILENLLENTRNYSRNESKEELLNSFNKFYDLFVEGKDFELSGKKFNIQDLGYTSRALANTYAEGALFYARNYLTEEQINKMDRALDDQNNKAQIRIILEVMSNQMVEESNEDLINEFNKKYQEVTNLFSGKVNLSKDSIKNLINYINIKYINSDMISTPDKNTILGEYNKSILEDVITSIIEIHEYNIKHPNEAISFRSLLMDEHSNTYSGMIDGTTLDYIQYNSTMEFVDQDSVFNSDSIGDSYIDNVGKYTVFYDFTQVYPSGLEVEVSRQDISSGVDLVAYTLSYYTLTRLPKDNTDRLAFIEFAKEGLNEAAKEIELIHNGECTKEDAYVYVKGN